MINRKQPSERLKNASLPIESDDAATDEETTLIKQDWGEEGEHGDSRGKYPKSVFFIIGNEFCERFSYYGMRTILTIYLTRVLLYGDSSATMIFHIFSMGCYFTPVLGAIIADSWLGKFKTIFYISIIYAVGNVVISIGSVPQSLQSMNALSLVGLGLIAVGTGGIKPCVSAFGGDQFEPGQELYLQQFFSFFYIAINLGSTISTFLTPVLRQDVKCFGEDTCFPAAFGVPAALMITSLIIFLIGKPLYKINPPKGNVIVEVVSCIFHAISRKFKVKEKKRDHWLDYADDTCSLEFIKGVKTLLHVLLLFLPLPVFWALFDQQGSKWTLQAARMDNRFFGYYIKPDQMQVFNPLLVIVMVPIFEYCIYPVLRKCHILVRPLQRMAVGGLLAAAAFVLTGLIQLRIEQTLPVLPSSGLSETTVINNSPCRIHISGAVEFKRSLSAYQDIYLPDIELGKTDFWTVSAEECEGVTEPATYNFTAQFPIQSVMITPSNGELRVIMAEDSKVKVETGNADVRLFYNVKDVQEQNGSRYIQLVGPEETFAFPISLTEELLFGVTGYKEVQPAEYKVHIPSMDAKKNDSTLAFEAQPGATYILAIFENSSSIVTLSPHTMVKPNSVHILYQILPYIVMTFGEIMFSITGLEFSYSQSPKSMKSVLQAAWLLTVAFGDLIVVIVAKSKFFKLQSTEFFMFAILMGIDMLIFAIMAVFYKYVKISEDEVDDAPNIKDSGKANEAYVEDTKF